MKLTAIRKHAVDSHVNHSTGEIIWDGQPTEITISRGKKADLTPMLKSMEKYVDLDEWVLTIKR